MCILTPRKPKAKSKGQASKKDPAKQRSLPQQLIYPYPPYTQNTTTQFYYAAPPPPPPPAKKHTTFYFSKPKKGSKAKIKKTIPSPPPHNQALNPKMPNNLAPWVAINTYALPPQSPPQQLQRRQNYSPYPVSTVTDWAYYEQMESVRLRQEQSTELDRYRRREDILHGMLADTISSRPQAPQQDNSCSEMKKELAALKQEFAEQNRTRELAEALEKGRKEGADSVRKEKEKENEAAKEGNGRWDVEREYGMFERSRGPITTTSGAGLNIDQRLKDLEIFERAVARSRRGLSPAPPVRRALLRQPGYDTGFGGYEDEYGYGSGSSLPSARRDFGDDLDMRLKGIEGSQQRMEQRFQLEDRRRAWEREHRQEDVLLRLNDTLGRLGRRFDY